MIRRNRSEELFQQAKSMFPGGVHSPVRAFKAVDGPPLFIEKGHGSRITDVDGNEFIDFCGSWGPLILGHAHPDVVQAVQDQVRKGTSFGAPSVLGNQLGSLILDNNKYIEKIRFVSSGTEAVMSAVRLARGYTGKNKIIKFEGCYHGHLDSLLVQAGSGLVTFGTSSSAGVPPSFVRETIVLPLADPDAVQQAFEKHGDDIAAVILEPIPANNGLLLQSPDYLRELRTITQNHNALLIFDEVISGFRVGFEGASGHYGIKPDLVTYGKIVGGGMPVGAFGGRADIMAHIAPEGPVYQAGTLSANPISMTAGYHTLQILSQPSFYDNLHKKCLAFYENLSTVLQEKGFGLQHMGSIFWIKFSPEQIDTPDKIPDHSSSIFRELYRHLLDHGIYLGPSSYEVGFVSDAHSTEELAHFVAAVSSF